MRVQPESPDCSITEIYFVYRYVIGYSGGGTTFDHQDNPCFTITATEIGTDHKTILYHSPQFATKPYNWDEGEGGDPRNYSDPCQGHEMGCNMPCGENGVVLMIEFTNNNRNMHLQGEGGDGCDLQMRVRLKSGDDFYKGEVSVTDATADDVEWPV